MARFPKTTGTPARRSGGSEPGYGRRVLAGAALGALQDESLPPPSREAGYTVPTVFVLSCVYNVLQFAMLWKTKTLELCQTASGPPVKFRMSGDWNVLYQAARWGL